MNRGIHDIVTPVNNVVVNDGGGSITVDGAVEITEPTLLLVTGTFSSLGNNTIIAAPGAGQIKITAIQIQSESTTESVAVINFGSTAKWRFIAREKGAGFMLPLAPGHVLPVGAGNALVVNLSVAATFNYSVAYYVE